MIYFTVDFSDCLNLMRLPLPVPGLLCTPRWAGPPWCLPPSRVMGQQWPLGTKTSISFLGCLSPLQIRSSSRKKKACKSLFIDPSTNYYVNKLCWPKKADCLCQVRTNFWRLSELQHLTLCRWTTDPFKPRWAEITQDTFPGAWRQTALIPEFIPRLGRVYHLEWESSSKFPQVKHL